MRKKKTDQSRGRGGARTEVNANIYFHTNNNSVVITIHKIWSQLTLFPPLVFFWDIIMVRGLLNSKIINGYITLV